MKPRIVVFYGGRPDNHDLSQETGRWVCQYIPRSTYEVTPVEVTAEGNWKVPLGGLPKNGHVGRTMDMLSQAVRPLPPRQAIARLLDRPVAGMMTTVRGTGGDDGGLHTLGSLLSIPVMGSPQDTCQKTSNKHMFSQAVGEITNTPYTRRFGRHVTQDEILHEVRDDFIPPLFVKPAHQEGSYGVELVENLDELAAAVSRASASDDEVLLQERMPGAEFSVSVFKDSNGKLKILPPTVIVPQKSMFYDGMSKRRGGRAVLHTPSRSDNPVVEEAEDIAHDVYEELGCNGLVTMDMIAGDDAVDLLEVNTVPTFSAHTPLIQQLKAAGAHPSHVLDELIRATLNGG